jgi:tRNA threonylcarbamoyladenosine biosynthesis protein TsaB
VAVAAGDRVLCVEHRAMAHGQAEALLPMVDRAMREARLAASDLDFVAVTTGPGSFTGIRIGLAAARGIALALDVPLIGVTGFEAAAAAVCDPDPGDQFLLVALESRRADLYVQLFNPARHALGAPAAVMPEALPGIVTGAAGGNPLAITGDAAVRAAAALAAGGCVSVVEDGEPAAIGTLRAALRRWRRGERDNPARPLYLRSPDVTLSAGSHRAERS